MTSVPSDSGRPPAASSPFVCPDPPVQWQCAHEYSDVLFERSDEGIARITINRPSKRNAFRPRTVQELCDAFTRVREDPTIGVVLFTGAGPAADGGWAFCAGGCAQWRHDPRSFRFRPPAGGFLPFCLPRPPGAVAVRP